MSFFYQNMSKYPILEKVKIVKMNLKKASNYTQT